MEKSVTSKQFILIAFVVGMAAKLFMLPSMLLKNTGRDAYLGMAVFCIADILMLIVMIAGMRLAGSKDFFTLLNDVLGAVLSRVFVVIIGLYHLYKVNLFISEIQEFFSVGLFEDFTWGLKIVVLLLLLLNAGKHRIRALARLCEILIPIILVSLFALCFMTFLSNYELANILPAMQDGNKLLNSVFVHTLWFGDYTVLILFFGRTQLKKRTGMIALIAALIAMTVVVFFNLVLSAAFGNMPELVNYGNNLANVTQYANGRVFGRIDLVIFTVWAAAVLISAMMFFNSSVRCVAFTVNTKRYGFVSAAVTIAVYILQVFLIQNQARIYSVSTLPPLAAIGIACQVMIPALALTLAAVGRRREKTVEAER